MSPLIFSAVLFAALLHAVWNALIKVSGDRLVIMAVTTFTAAVLVIPLLFILPLPQAASWPYLAASVLAHAAYMLLLVRAYGFGDFVQVYPLSRGSAPLLTALAGFILLQETLHVTELAGMLLIVLGIFMLAAERSSGSRQMSRQAVFYSLLTGLSISFYSVIDGVGARLSGNSHSFAVWMFFLDGFFIPFIAVMRRREILLSTVKQVWQPGVVVAIASSVAYWLIIWAFSQERIALVAVLRESSVLFALLISAFVLREVINPKRLLVIALVVCGVIMLGF